MSDNNIEDENRTETIGIRFSKTEKHNVEDFIEEYNRKNDTKLNKTEFIRTAIFTHMYYLDNSDYVFDVDYFEKSIDKINTNLTRVKNVFNDVEKRIKEVREDITSLRYHNLIQKINNDIKSRKK